MGNLHKKAWDNCPRTLEEQLEKATAHLVRMKVKYRQLRSFLEGKGVPSAYFDEWNAQFNAEYSRDREYMLPPFNKESNQ